uniref:Uncharacterized protein n=1 Tax=Homalodisca liturata TaxID=320908 RepID=A0A1B6HHQ7_9HEMI
MGIKEYIRYFDKVRDTMASTRRTTSAGWQDDETEGGVPAYGPAEADSSVCEAESSSSRGCMRGEPAGPKSKIELLKEQIFKKEEQPYKDEERMVEVENLCRVRGAAERAEGRSASGDAGPAPGSAGADISGVDVAAEAPGTSTAGKAEPLPPTRSVSSKSCDNSEDLLRDLESLDTCEFMEFDEKLNEKIEELNKDSQASTAESEMSDVITRDIVVDSVFNSNGISKLDEEVRSHVSVLRSEIESQFRTQLAEPRPPAASKLPNSSELAGDFRNFKARPALFRCRPLSCPSQVVSKNLFTSCVNKEYSNATEKTLADALTVSVPLFSRQDLASQRHVFRGPGAVMSSRPTLRFHSSILTEQGVLYYLSVSGGGENSWFVRKSLDIRADVASVVSELNALPDRDFNAFIVSDVVTSVFRRTSYVYYNGRIVLLKFVGRSLCVCDGKRIVHVVRLDGAAVARLDGARPSFVVGGTAFGSSCIAERDEWFGCIAKMVDERC